MRPVTATAAAVTSILGAGAAAVAAGRYASDVALKATPGRPLPADRRLTVHATAAGQVTLTRSFSALRPGTWGIAGSGVHAVVGPCRRRGLRGRRHRRPQAGERRSGDPRTGHEGPAHPPALYGGDPGSDLGLDHSEVEIPGELGALPAWYVPGARDTWIITVHGLGATRAHPMNLMGFLHRQRFPCSTSPTAATPEPPPADGLGHFGALRVARRRRRPPLRLRYGARNVIVHGWSTGATMALYAAVESPLRDRISGLVLDSPVLDWPVTLRALAAARGVPAALLPLAVRAAQGRTGMGATPVLETSVPASLRTPTLILHGPDDTIAPWGPPANSPPGARTWSALHAVPQAPHAAMWNVGPDRYEETLRRFLTPLM